MYYQVDQKTRKTMLFSVAILVLMLLELPVVAQEDEGVPQQEQVPPQEQTPGQDEMQDRDQMQQQKDATRQSEIPQQQAVDANYTDEELKSFIDANMEATKVQQETQQEMVAAIEDEGLEVQKFNEIMTAQQNPQQEVAASEDDLEKFNKAAEKVMVIQQEMQTEVVEAIEKTGMDVNTYSEMMLAYQNSLIVQEKVHKIMQEQEQN